MPTLSQDAMLKLARAKRHLLRHPGDTEARRAYRQACEDVVTARAVQAIGAPVDGRTLPVESRRRIVQLLVEFAETEAAEVAYAATAT